MHALCFFYLTFTVQEEDQEEEFSDHITDEEFLASEACELKHTWNS